MSYEIVQDDNDYLFFNENIFTSTWLFIEQLVVVISSDSSSRKVVDISRRTDKQGK